LRKTSGLALGVAALGLGLTGSSTSGQREAEELLLAVPSAASFEKHLRYLTEEPHQTGTPRNMELADYVRDRFKEYGLSDVAFHDTPALLPRARSASVELVDLGGPEPMKLRLAEEPYPEDKDSYLYRNPKVVPFHGYAPGGDVTAEVVYANGGSPEDFAKLDEMGVDVRGKIVVMRYSNPYSYRGYKVYLAESRGAAGSIIYSDPQDDGYVKGETYPQGPWGPPSHIQWGAIIYDWFGPGEPFTFHWTRQRDGTWLEGPVRDKQLPRIPSLPMSHEAAAEILSRLRGPAVPEGWQGGLPFTYHVGPGPVRVRLVVDNHEEIGTLRNVIGMISGSEEPDSWVVIGNHRDAWVYGAVDPSSGTAALLEVARTLGEATKRGYRPRRTVVLANWDGEEELLGGSTSWAKDNREKLLKDGVVYVNVDHAASGPDFNGGSTPALAAFLKEVTRAVPDPGGGSLYDAWASRSSEGEGAEPVIEEIVGATDYTAFQENIGMSCIDMSFVGPYGVYHSQYDNYFWLSRIGDPGFRYNTTLARLWALLTWRMANADVLPMRYSDYARKVATYFDEVEKKARPERALVFESGRAAARRWEEAAGAFEKRLDERLASGAAVPREAAQQINALLMAIERALTEPQGLKTRPFFKHLVYAPQPTYREELLPRIFEAIEAREWGEIPRYEAQLVAAFDRAGDLLRRAEALLP